MTERCYLRVLLVFLAALLLSDVNHVSAQSTLPRNVDAGMGAPEGARRYRPGVWGLVEVYAVNRTDAADEAETVLRFLEDPTLQYGRRVWVPAHATLRTTCPILVPDFLPADTRHVELLTEQLDRSSPASTERRSPQEAAMAAKPMILDHNLPAIGMIVGSDESPRRDNPDLYYGGDPLAIRMTGPSAQDMVLAAKRSLKLSGHISLFDPVDLPADPACLEILDVLVLASNRLAADVGGTTIVRDWVLGGGRLWITLDRVQPASVAGLLGEAFVSSVVDRVSLTSLRIENARSDLAYRDDTAWTFEEPVEMARVIAQGVTVTDTVDGWPAAFWQPFGAGRVYFTTVGPAAWIYADDDAAAQSSETEGRYFFTGEALDSFASDLLVPRSAPELDSGALRPFLSEQIGYRILGRTAVIALLATFCVVLLGAGLWFFHTGTQERLLWAAPLAAIVTCLVFLVVATSAKRSVPPTVATIARVVLEPGVSTGHSYGLAAIYNQEASEQRLGATDGGIFFPDMTALTGRHRRMMWTDEGAWHWEDLELPAGVRTAPLKRCLSLDKTVDCRARFDGGGLTGSIGLSPFTHLEDAIIAIPHQPVMRVNLDRDGRFTSGSDDVLSSGEFMSGTWLDDSQQRRQAIYEQLFASPPETDLPPRPILYAWADDSDTGFVFPQANRISSTLLSIPLRLEQTPPGTAVTIPAPFLPYRAVAAPDGRLPAVFSNLTRQWMETKSSATDWLRFQLPATLLPIQLERATLSLKVRAPSRSLEVLALVDDQLVAVAQFPGPIGTYLAELDRPELLQLDDAGGLRIAIRVSEDETKDRADELSQATWKIETLQMEVTGTVQGP